MTRYCGHLSVISPLLCTVVQCGSVDKEGQKDVSSAELQLTRRRLVHTVRGFRRNKPGLLQLQSQLADVITMHEDKAKCKSKLCTARDPILAAAVFYVLPQKLLKACLALLAPPVEDLTSEEDEQEDQSSDQDSQDAMARGPCVNFKGVGTYSKSQIKAMVTADQLQTDSGSGLLLCAWLRERVLGDKLALRIAAVLESTYPGQVIRNVPHFPPFSCLYTLRPGVWMCVLCVSAHPSGRALGVPRHCEG